MTDTAPTPEPQPHDPGPNARVRTAWLAAALWTVLVAALAAWELEARLRDVREQAFTTAGVRLGAAADTLTISFRQLAALPASLARRAAVISFLAPGRRPDLELPAARRREAYAAYRHDPTVEAMYAELGAIGQDFGLPFIALIDAQGEVRASTIPNPDDPFAVPPPLRSREYFTRALASGSGAQFLFGRVSGVPGVYFATRVQVGDQPLGVVAVKQDATVLNRLLGGSEGDTVFVTDANGAVVLSNRSEVLMRRLPAASSPQAADWRALYRAAPEDLPWQLRPLPLGSRTATVAEFDGQRNVVRSLVLPGVPFTVWVMTPLHDENGTRRQVVTGALVAWLFGAVLIWFGWRRLQLLEMALRARREIGELAEALPLTAFRYEQPPRGPGRFSFLGRGVERLFGVEAKALERDPALPWRLAGSSDNAPPTEPVEFSVWRGQQRAWVLAHSTPKTARDGSTIYNGYWLDVSSRHESEARFEAVFEHAATGYLFFDRQVGLTAVNPAAVRLFGATRREELLGRIAWFPTLSPELQADGRPSRARAIELMVTHTRSRERVQSFEWRFQRLDGSTFDTDVSVIVLEWEGSPQFCAVVQDITARKQAEAAMREARQAAEAASRTKSSFLANMSHELRTPMNAIIGMTHLALEDGLPDKQRDYVEKANSSARNLLQILNDILDVSKIEAGQMQLEHIDFEIDAVVGEMADVLGLKADEKGLELLFTSSSDLPRRLVGDPTRLRQVLVNLGSNAIKFTDAGEVTVGMELQSQSEREVELHVWVRDSGVGMTQEEQQRLFQPFVQADSSTTRRFGGTGLGLVISRELVERMGGRLWLESRPGRGSTFHFTARFGRSVPRAPARAWVVGEMRGRRVLLVDDNPAAIDVLGHMLEALGVQVEPTLSGAQALEVFDREGPQAFAWVLIDWKMPTMDGVACAREMLRRHPDAKPCILLVTAFGREDALRAGAGLPLAGVLQKPVTPSTLYDCLLQAQRITEPAGMPAAPAASVALADGVRRRLAGARILVVEDHPLNQELAQELLRRAGMEVVLAHNGQDALDRLADAGPFDGVLMDCQMPIMDGYTATATLRTRPEWAQLPVIAMTASALAEDRDRAIASGMNAHITKPLNVELMMRTMAQWIHVGDRHEPEPTAPAELDWPPAGAGTVIDTADGLARCLGKTSLYRRLLHGFRQAKSDFAGELRRAQAEGRDADALRSVHDLKGLAGTIGAHALHTSARALQELLLAREQGNGAADEAAYEAALERVGADLAEVLRDINQLVPPG